MTNRILSIPKYKLPFDNGITFIDDIWLKYNNQMLYRDLTDSFRLFYRIVPYLILTNNDRYLVLNNNGHYCFNLKGICYIRDGIIYEPIKSIVKTCIRKNNIKAKSLECCGFIKSIKDNPDDIAVLYIATIEDIKLENTEWMNLNELINKCRRFDSFGIEYINYLVCKKY